MNRRKEEQEVVLAYPALGEAEIVTGHVMPTNGGLQ